MKRKMEVGPHGRRCSNYNSARVVIIALLKYTRTLIHWTRGYTWTTSTHFSLKMVRIEKKMEGTHGRRRLDYYSAI